MPTHSALGAELLEKYIIELLTVSYLILALLQNSHYVINFFCIVSLFMHLNEVLSARTTYIYTTPHKIMMLSIACALVFFCLTLTRNPIIINLGWFVLVSKLLDFFSTRNTLFEETTTFLTSTILTLLSMRFLPLLSSRT